jgi:hypothetical protein
MPKCNPINERELKTVRSMTMLWLNITWLLYIIGLGRNLGPPVIIILYVIPHVSYMLSFLQCSKETSLPFVRLFELNLWSTCSFPRKKLTMHLAAWTWQISCEPSVGWLVPGWLQIIICFLDGFWLDIF